MTTNPISTEFVITEQKGSVLEITINRPEAKNALSIEMYKALTAALQKLDEDDRLNVALIKGTSDCFTAGNDLNDFLKSGELNREHPTVQFLYQLVNTKKPIVAAVSGVAVGIGTTMLLHCDLVYADQTAHFQMPFAKLGLCPEAASSLLFNNLAGPQKAFQYLVLGEAFNAQQAEQLGLVNESVETGVVELATEKAQQLATLPAQSVIESKRLIKLSQIDKTEQTITLELEQFGKLLKSDDCQNIIKSFFKKG